MRSALGCLPVWAMGNCNDSTNGFVLYVVEVCTIRSDVRQYRDTASNDVVFL